MFTEPEGTKVFETDFLAADLTNADEVKMDVQKGSGAKDTYEPLSSTNPPISVSAPKALSFNMDSRYLFPNKTPSFS